MKAILVLGTAVFMLTGCVVVPAEPVPVVRYAPPPAVVVRPAPPVYYYGGPYRRYRYWR